MCEFSNTALKTRKAAQGDQLVVASVNEGCVGFADAAQCDTSVCLTHGTELAFDQSVKFYNDAGIETDSTQCTATFVEVDPEHKQHVFSDALIIVGQPEPVYLVSLIEGQSAKVIQLPAAELPIKGDAPAVDEGSVGITRQVEHA